MGNVRPCTASLGHASLVQCVTCSSLALWVKIMVWTINCKAMVLHTYQLAYLSLSPSPPHLSPSVSPFLFPHPNTFLGFKLSTTCNCQIVVSGFGRPQTMQFPEMDSSSVVCTTHSRAELGAQVSGLKS